MRFGYTSDGSDLRRCQYLQVLMAFSMICVKYRASQLGDHVVGKLFPTSQICKREEVIYFSPGLASLDPAILCADVGALIEKPLHNGSIPDGNRRFQWAHHGRRCIRVHIRVVSEQHIKRRYVVAPGGNTQRRAIETALDGKPKYGHLIEVRVPLPIRILLDIR